MSESAKVEPERQGWAGNVCRKPTGPLQDAEGELKTAAHHSGAGKMEGFNSPSRKDQMVTGLRSSDAGSVDTEALGGPWQDGVTQWTYRFPISPILQNPSIQAADVALW